MKLVTQTDVAAWRFGEESAVKIISKAGFEGIDYSMFRMEDEDDYVLNTPSYEKHALNLKNIAESCGVTFEQAHAPFPSARDGDEAFNAKMLPRLRRSIEVAGIVGAKIIVVHPVYYKHRKFEKNMELYHALEDTAKEFNVKVALENMWGRKKNGRIIPNVCSVPDEFNSYVDALDKRYFTACLDLGHCGLVGETADNMIRKMNSRIGCLHIHDNDNISDCHTLPYTRDMDWNKILRALADIKYEGNFTFEADSFTGSFPNELIPDALEFMAKTGRSMISKIYGYRNENG